MFKDGKSVGKRLQKQSQLVGTTLQHACRWSSTAHFAMSHHNKAFLVVMRNTVIFDCYACMWRSLGLELFSIRPIIPSLCAAVPVNAHAVGAKNAGCHAIPKPELLTNIYQVLDILLYRAWPRGRNGDELPDELLIPTTVCGCCCQ